MMFKNAFLKMVSAAIHSDNETLLVTYTFQHSEILFFAFPSMLGSWG